MRVASLLTLDTIRRTLLHRRVQASMSTRTEHYCTSCVLMYLERYDLSTYTNLVSTWTCHVTNRVLYLTVKVHPSWLQYETRTSLILALDYVCAINLEESDY